MSAEELILDYCGGKRCKTWIPDTKWSDLEVGKQFWHFDNEKIKWVLITINHIRSGVAFFSTRKNGKEDYIEDMTVMLRRFEPKTYISDLNPKCFEVISRSGRVKIKYAK